MALRLPSRYEDLDAAYHGRLIPDQKLLALVNRAKKSIEMSGGIRFLPLWGQSGAGKSCAAIEISTHMPTVHTFILSREEIESKELLLKRMLFPETGANTITLLFEKENPNAQRKQKHGTKL